MGAARAVPLLGVVAVLAACSSGEGEAGEQAQANAETIPCALGGRDFSARCTIERVVEGGKRMMLVRHPDGGFRRFELLDKSPWIATADGSQQAMFAPDSPYYEVYVGDDAYQLPISFRSDVPKL